MINEIPNTFEIHSPKHGGYGDNIVQIDVDDNGKRKVITFWRSLNGTNWGSEIYSGPNYVEPYNVKNKSYSRNYIKWKDLPVKWAGICKDLMYRHDTIDWSVN